MNRFAPRHVGIIMDGNGRWAEARGQARSLGHQEGARRVREITEAARRLGISALTLYAFSAQNWARPADEVIHLMQLLVAFLEAERETLVKNGIRLAVAGQVGQLPRSVRSALAQTQEATKGGTEMVLTLALSYGGREELLAVMDRLVQEPPSGPIQVADVERHLWTAGLPELDLVIRTGGDHRLSNFLLWQAAYAELMFVPALWPDFSEPLFHACLSEFATRERRFGQVPSAEPAQSAESSSRALRKPKRRRSSRPT